VQRTTCSVSERSVSGERSEPKGSLLRLTAALSMTCPKEYSKRTLAAVAWLGGESTRALQPNVRKHGRSCPEAQQRIDMLTAT
jgi:hypothetical protein